MELITIKENIIINPEYIAVIEKKAMKVVVRMIGGYSYDVEVPTKEFFDAVKKYGVDLSKQYFSV